MPDLSELKDHLNIKNGAHDAELLTMLDAATAHVEKLVGPLTPTPVVEFVRYGFLSYRPVVEVTAASYYGTDVLSSVSVDKVTGMVYGAAVGTTVSYTYGHDSESPTQRLAILLTAAHLWETQRGTAPTALQDPDGTPSFIPGVADLVPPRAMQLLAPDIASGQVA